MAGKAQRTEQTKQAPGSLELVQRFVNTRNQMRGYDVLGTSEQAAKWLEESGYGRSNTAQDPVEGPQLTNFLRELREELRVLLLSNNLGASSETRESSSKLNDLVGNAALGVVFRPTGEPHLVSSSTGTERLIQDLLLAAVEASYGGSEGAFWQRLKACANEECRWVFYDFSKNHSGSWCVMEICGSRAKMRSYRERHPGNPPEA